MPKVTTEYIQNKKKMIIDVAYELCIEKTVSTVTMQDIINRTGLSQGGIYRFYKDIDEIFRDMLIDVRKKVSFKDKVDEIFERIDEIPEKEIAYMIFDTLAEFMEDELMGIEKLDFELSILAINSPKRMEKILSSLPDIGNKEYVMKRTMEYFIKKIQQGKCTPRVSGEELYSYITSAYSGVQMCCIVNNCYKQSAFSELYKPRKQFKTVAKTVNYLLGIE
jgi:AcrR family transcriptional regulator